MWESKEAGQEILRRGARATTGHISVTVLLSPCYCVHSGGWWSTSYIMPVSSWWGPRTLHALHTCNSFLHSGPWKMIPPLFYNVGFTIISYGETNRSEDNGHWKDSLLLIVPERRAHTMARWALWRSSRVSQEEKAEKGNADRNRHWLLLEGMGEVGSAGQGLVRLTSFSGIWGVSFNPGWSGQGVEGPNKQWGRLGVWLWIGGFVYELSAWAVYSSRPGRGQEVRLGS